MAAPAIMVIDAQQRDAADRFTGARARRFAAADRKR
jgi:hypothetical protein